MDWRLGSLFILGKPINGLGVVRKTCYISDKWNRQKAIYRYGK